MDERKSWSYATAVLASIALIVFFLGMFSTRFFVPEFEIFVVYIPALFAFVVFIAQFKRKTPETVG